MTRTTSITVDQFVAASPATAWRGLTEPPRLAAPAAELAAVREWPAGD